MKKFSIFFIIIILISSSIFSSGAPEVETKEIDDISKTLLELETLYKFVERYFIYEIDIEDLSETLTKSLMTGLGDQHSTYFVDDEIDDLEKDINGSYIGIGIYLTKADPSYIDRSNRETYMARIVSPFSNGPAERAGLKPGDFISHVDGKDISSLDSNEVSKLLKGEEGVPYSLTVHRANHIFEVSLTPEKIDTPNISSTIVDNIGYIRISTFNTQTADLFSEALIELKVGELDGLVIDLRNNYGGIVTSALKISNYFLEKDTPLIKLIYSEKSGIKETVYTATNESRKYLNLPIVLLSNEGSASSSEILMASLKENDRAVVIGQNSFGKGTVQDIMKYKNGYIKLTTAEYVDRNDVKINKIGIKPDIETQEEMIDASEYFSFLSDNEDKIEEFLLNNAEFTDTNVDKFITTFKTDKLSEYALKAYIKSRYLEDMNIDDRPIVDLELDTTLLEAINYIKNL